MNLANLTLETLLQIATLAAITAGFLRTSYLVGRVVERVDHLHERVGRLEDQYLGEVTSTRSHRG